MKRSMQKQLKPLKKFLAQDHLDGTQEDGPNTRDLVFDEGGFLYDSDSYGVTFLTGNIEVKKTTNYSLYFR